MFLQAFIRDVQKQWQQNFDIEQLQTTRYDEWRGLLLELVGKFAAGMFS